MISLIKNELTKIFKKKAIYIILFVTFAFVILSNLMYKYFYSDGSYSYYSESYVEFAKEGLQELDPEKPSDTKMYIEYKTVVDTNVDYIFILDAEQKMYLIPKTEIVNKSTINLGKRTKKYRVNI